MEPTPQTGAADDATSTQLLTAVPPEDAPLAPAETDDEPATAVAEDDTATALVTDSAPRTAVITDDAFAAAVRAYDAAATAVVPKVGPDGAVPTDDPSATAVVPTVDPVSAVPADDQSATAVVTRDPSATAIVTRDPSTTAVVPKVGPVSAVRTDDAPVTGVVPRQRTTAGIQERPARSPVPVVEPVPAEDFPWWWTALPVGLLTALLAVIGYRRELWVDEYYSVYVTRLSRPDFLRLLHHADIVHAVYYELLRLWTTVFGHSLLALRAPSIIAMAVAAGGVTVLGRRLHSPALGVFAGLFFAILPSVARYGQEIRSYAWVNALTVLATLALFWALDQPRSHRRWALYGLAVLAFIYLNFAAAMVLLPHGLIVLSAWRRERRGLLPRWLAAAGGAVLLAAPLVFVASRQSGQVNWVTNGMADVRWYPGDLVGSDVLFWAVAMLAIVGGLRLWQSRPDLATALLAWVVVPPVFAYLSNSVAHLFLARYELFLVPALVLLAACAFVPPAASPTRAAQLPIKAVAGATAALAFLVLASWPGQFQIRQSPREGEPDFRRAAAVVNTGYQPGDGIVYSGDRNGRIPFMYELHRATPKDVYLQKSSQQVGTFAALDCKDPLACLGTTPRVWLVASVADEDYFRFLPTNEAQPLEQGYQISSVTRYVNVRVVLLVRNPPAPA